MVWMMRKIGLPLTALALIFCGLAAGGAAQSGRAARAEALAVHTRAIVIDAHVHQLFPGDDGGQVNLNSMREAGIDAVCFSLPLRREGITGLAARVREDIALIREGLNKSDGKARLALGAGDIRRNHDAGIGSILLSLEYFDGVFERGAGTLSELWELGVRSITLTTSSVDRIGITGDDTGDDVLNDFGRGIVREMNRLGLLIDITHLNELLLPAVIRESRAPVIASHSNARAVIDSARNLPDDIIRAIAEKGGAVMLGFDAAFLMGSGEGGRAGPGLQSLLAHIDHIVKIAGVESVGIGSDYGGSGANAPGDLATAACFPRITAALLRRGYPAADAARIMGGNFLRVLDAVERSKYP